MWIGMTNALRFIAQQVAEIIGPGGNGGILMESTGYVLMEDGSYVLME